MEDVQTKYSSKKRKISYEKCKISYKGNCGPYKRWNKEGMYKVKDLNSDVSDHLVKSKVN